MRECISTERTGVAAKSQQEARVSIQAQLVSPWRWGEVAYLGQEAEKMGNITTHLALW